MAYLINRNAPARFECLHALVKMINKRFNNSSINEMSQLKFEPSDDNIHCFCSLLISSQNLNLRHCPYKENPLDLSGCALTNGKTNDTTKSKEISNTINALHGLGFITRNSNNSIVLTNFGAQFANAETGTANFQNIVEKSVLNYGPIIGLLNEINKIATADTNFIFSTSNLITGYPYTKEIIENVTISSGSTDDANTRTKSCLLAWLTSAGFIEPLGVSTVQNKYPHIKYQKYIIGKTRSIRKYKLTKQIPFIKAKFTTERPLDYNNLTKSTSSLRENNMEKVRELTLKFESRIKNRRYAIIYLLYKAFENNSVVRLSEIKQLFLKYPGLFIVSKENLDKTISEEINIASIAGIPYNISKQNNEYVLSPVCSINIHELSLKVPSNLQVVL